MTPAPPPAAPADLAAQAAARLPGFLLLGLVVGTVNGLARVAMPLYAAALGAPAWQVGLVGAFGYAGLVMLSLPMGGWIDRAGPRQLFVRGALVAAGLYLLLPLWAKPAGAVLGAWLLGLALPFRTVPVHTEFLALLPHLGAAKAGWNRAAFTLGMFFLGPALSAAVVAALGFAPVFQLAAAGLLLACLVARRVLPGAPAEPGPMAQAALGQRLRAQWALLRTQDDLRRNMGIDFFTQMAVAYFVVFGLVLAVRQVGFSLQAAAGLVTVQGALFVLTMLAGGRWLARWHDDRRYLLAFALMGAHCLLMALGGWGHWPAALWLSALCLGLGAGVQGLASVNRYALLMAQFGRARVGGLSALAAPVGGLLGALGGGLLSQALGSAAGFWLMGAVYAVLGAGQWRRLLAQRAGPGGADPSA